MRNQTTSYIGQRGQVVIPVQYRKQLGITPEKPLNIYLDGKKIILELAGSQPHDNTLLYKAMENAKGSWADDPYDDHRELELAAAKKRKNSQW